MKVFRALVAAVSLACLTFAGGSAVFAKDAKTMKMAKATPNCEVKGKKHHLKDKAACEKKKGKWLEADASAPAAMPAAGTDASSTAAPAAATEPKK